MLTFVFVLYLGGLHNHMYVDNPLKLGIETKYAIKKSNFHDVHTCFNYLFFVVTVCSAIGYNNSAWSSSGPISRAGKNADQMETHLLQI